LFLFCVTCTSFAGSYIQQDSTKVSPPPVSSSPVIETEKVDSTPSELKSTGSHPKYDKIVKKNGEIIRCIISEKNIYEISYINPQTNKITTISTNNVKEIRYATGKKELIDNNPEKAPKDWVVTSGEKDWQKVKITYLQKDVESLVEKGPIDATFEAIKLDATTEVMERNANIILKKKAAKIGATIVYVSYKHVNKTYGEMPSIEMKGVAYGNE
jgi:hypothetical protein